MIKKTLFVHRLSKYSRHLIQQFITRFSFSCYFFLVRFITYEYVRMIRSYGAMSVDQSDIVYLQRVIGRTNRTLASTSKGRQKLKTKNQAALEINKWRKWFVLSPVVRSKYTDNLRGGCETSRCQIAGKLLEIFKNIGMIKKIRLSPDKVVF